MLAGCLIWGHRNSKAAGLFHKNIAAGGYKHLACCLPNEALALNGGSP